MPQIFIWWENVPKEKRNPLIKLVGEKSEGVTLVEQTRAKR